MGRPYNEFKASCLGNRIDYDNCYKYQCVDLIKYYLDKCLGYGKIGSLWNAKQLPNNSFFKWWAKLVLKPSTVMQWDIVVRTIWEYGHVAIVDRVVGGKLVVLEQNGTGKNSGSGKDGNEIRTHAYDFWFFDVVLRSDAITKNFNLERSFVLDKIKTLKTDLDTTVDYYRAIHGGYYWIDIDNI